MKGNESVVSKVALSGSETVAWLDFERVDVKVVHLDVSLVVLMVASWAEVTDVYLVGDLGMTMVGWMAFVLAVLLAVC